jgi:hypothetical protein
VCEVRVAHEASVGMFLVRHQRDGILSRKSQRQRFYLFRIPGPCLKSPSTLGPLTRVPESDAWRSSRVLLPASE